MTTQSGKQSGNSCQLGIFKKMFETKGKVWEICKVSNISVGDGFFKFLCWFIRFVKCLINKKHLKTNKTDFTLKYSHFTNVFLNFKKIWIAFWQLLISKYLSNEHSLLVSQLLFHFNLVFENSRSNNKHLTWLQSETILKTDSNLPSIQFGVIQFSFASEISIPNAAIIISLFRDGVFINKTIIFGNTRRRNSFSFSSSHLIYRLLWHWKMIISI